MSRLRRRNTIALRVTTSEVRAVTASHCRLPCCAASRLAEGEHAILAPTDGVYYGRPTPDASPFVERGSRVQRGQPIGLVEVMKTFNQILYEGDDLPGEAEIVDIRAEDGDEIAAGSVLMVVRSV